MISAFCAEEVTLKITLLIIYSAGYYHVTVVTCLDELKDDGAKGEALSFASWTTGSSETRTYLIENYTHENKETSLEVERTALDILECALISAEQFIRIRRQREKNQME